MNDEIQNLIALNESRLFVLVEQENWKIPLWENLRLGTVFSYLNLSPFWQSRLEYFKSNNNDGYIVKTRLKIIQSPCPRLDTYQILWVTLSSRVTRVLYQFSIKILRFWIVLIFETCLFSLEYGRSVSIYETARAWLDSSAWEIDPLKNDLKQLKNDFSR